MIKRLLIILMIFFAAAAHAEETKKISMAIMEFRANNTKEAFGKACMDMLSEKLFATNLFTLMEKNQMDRIARQNGFKEFNIIDPQQIARLGRVLNVDKMLVGSITYIDSYIIDVKVLNARTGEIEFNIIKKISTIEKLEDCLEDIAVTIERHYLGYYNLGGVFDLTFEAHFLYPFAVFSDAASPGAGVLAMAQFNNPFDLPFNIQAAAEFYSFTPVDSSMDYFYSFPVFLCASYKFIITRNINFIPSAGAGYLFSRVSSDSTTAGEDRYWEGQSLFYNPVLVLRTEFDIFLYDRWYLTLTPQYNIFFEKERTGQFLSMGIGIKMLF